MPDLEARRPQRAKWKDILIVSFAIRRVKVVLRGMQLVGYPVSLGNRGDRTTESRTPTNGAQTCCATNLTAAITL